MKVMNEIKAEKSGVVTAIVAEDGTPSNSGPRLFLIQ
jgi:acetyl-CoA carboxylase biotin carboxyl carrier protein